MRRILSTLLFWVSIVASIVAAIFVYEWLSQFIHRGFAFPLGIVVFGIIHWILNLKIFNRPSKKNMPVLNIDSSELEISYPDGESDKVGISDVNKIEILTTNKGPWSEDLWWLFYAETREEPFCVPQMALGNEKIFDLLKSSFDQANMYAVIKAMGSTSNAKFEVLNS